MLQQACSFIVVVIVVVVVVVEHNDSRLTLLRRLNVALWSGVNAN